MDAYEPAQSEPTAPFASAPEQPALVDSADVLPTMADLDRLAADLDRVDLTLVEIDGPVPAS